METSEQPSSILEGPTGKLVRDFLSGTVVIGQEVMRKN